jgi:hypothetical protein
MLLRRYQARYNQSQTERALENLLEAYPGLAQAHSIRNDDRYKTRWVLEARLLTGEPVERISARTCISTETIRWYEKCFFNVADRLEAPDWVCNNVIGAAIQRGLSDRDYDVLWKIFGYSGGPLVLDAAITTIGNPVADRWFHADAMSTLARKAAISARTMPVAFNHAALMEAHARFREIAKAEGAGASQAGLQEQVRALMDHVGQYFAPGALDSVASEKFLSYDKKAVELRASETLTVAAGGSIDYHKDVDWTFPEKSKDAPNQQPN